MKIDELDTPSLIVDLDRMERNIRRMAAFVKECGVSLRAHAKTHKVPEISKLQLKEGSKGICLQKVSEVEIFAANGLNDIFLTNEVVTRPKLERLARIPPSVRLGIAADSLEAIQLMSQVFRDAGREIDVYVDVDTGMHRCGVRSTSAPALATEIARRENLVFRGLMGYEGNVNQARTKKEQMRLSKAAMDEIVEAKKGVENKGIKVDVVSVGSSVSTQFNAKHPDVTEVQPGMYIFNDHVLVKRGVATWDDLALTVAGTVMSKPARARAVVDAGSKAFNFDVGLYPVAFEQSGIVMDHFSEEHGWLRLTGNGKDVAVGDVIRFVPAHCCTAVNQFDELFGVRNGKVERKFSVVARGKMQ